MTLDELEAMSEAAAEEASDYAQRLDDLSARDYTQRLANGDTGDDANDNMVVCNMCHCFVLRGYQCWTCEDMGFF